LSVCSSSESACVLSSVPPRLEDQDQPQSNRKCRAARLERARMIGSVPTISGAAAIIRLRSCNCSPLRLPGLALRIQSCSLSDMKLQMRAGRTLIRDLSRRRASVIQYKSAGRTEDCHFQNLHRIEISARACSWNDAVQFMQESFVTANSKRTSSIEGARQADS
jgi:hypothetical protein